MCSVDTENWDGNAAEAMVQNNAIKFENLTCKKCRQLESSIVLRGKDIYCKPCFLSATTHKFKAFLGKNRLIRPNNKVLVIVKPGHSSTALLHFLRNGLDLDTPKKLRFVPIIAYIEDRVDLSVAQRKQILEDIQKEIESFNFSANLISFPEYLKNDLDVAKALYIKHDELSINKEDRTVIGGIKNLSLQNDHTEILQRDLIIKVAKVFGCKCVFTTDLGVDLASKLLSGVALGRGKNLSNEIGLSDDRDPEVKIIQPLRIFDMKELAFYNIFNNLTPTSAPPKPQEKFSSVQSLMKKFVEDLQVNYPSTITTVVKTGEKLALDKSFQGDKTCVLCKGIVGEETEDLTSEESTTFSQWISSQSPDYSLSSTDRYKNLFTSFQKNRGDDYYCFACKKLPDIK